MTTRRLQTSSSGTAPAAGSSLSPEQRTKYDELLAWARLKEKEYAALSPQELAREEAEWQAVLRGMNEDRTRSGSRPLAVDPK